MLLVVIVIVIVTKLTYPVLILKAEEQKLKTNKKDILRARTLIQASWILARLVILANMPAQIYVYMSAWPISNKHAFWQCGVV